MQRQMAATDGSGTTLGPRTGKQHALKSAAWATAVFGLTQVLRFGSRLIFNQHIQLDNDPGGERRDHLVAGERGAILPVLAHSGNISEKHRRAARPGSSDGAQSASQLQSCV